MIFLISNFLSAKNPAEGGFVAIKASEASVLEQNPFKLNFLFPSMLKLKSVILYKSFS